jgi:hypothetical protein
MPLLLAVGLVSAVILSIQQQTAIRTEIIRLEAVLPVISEEVVCYGGNAELQTSRDFKI